MGGGRPPPPTVDAARPSVAEVGFTGASQSAGAGAGYGDGGAAGAIRSTAASAPVFWSLTADHLGNPSSSSASSTIC